MAEAICAAIEGDGFEHYVPDLKAVAEFKTSDIDGFLAGAVGFAGGGGDVKALQFLADPEPWPEPLPDDAPPPAPQPGDHADGAGRPARPAAARRRLGRAADPRHRHLRLGLEAGAHGLRRQRRQPDDRVHLVPAGAGPRGRGHGHDHRPEGDRARRRASGSCCTRASGAGPGASRPLCPACERGDYSICSRFHDGHLSPGIHTGNATDATGGFAERCPPTRSMAIPVPDDVPDEVAVLADPWSVSLHAITRNPPPPGGRRSSSTAPARSGTTATAILTQLYDCRGRHVARWPAQADLARSLGATVFDPGTEAAEPEAAREALVEQLAAWSGGVLRRPWDGLPCAYPGQIDVVYDTVGAPATVEVGLRVLREQGTLVQLGVTSPARFEWTPWYFKELRLIGSNAFGDETFEGRRQHAFEHYFDLLHDGRVDLARHAHPPVPPRRVARRLHHHRRPGDDRRDQGRVRLPVTWAHARAIRSHPASPAGHSAADLLACLDRRGRPAGDRDDPGAGVPGRPGVALADRPTEPAGHPHGHDPRRVRPARTSTPARCG